MIRNVVQFCVKTGSPSETTVFIGNTEGLDIPDSESRDMILRAEIVHTNARYATPWSKDKAETMPVALASPFALDKSR